MVNSHQLHLVHEEGRDKGRVGHGSTVGTKRALDQSIGDGDHSVASSSNTKRLHQEVCEGNSVRQTSKAKDDTSSPLHAMSILREEPSSIEASTSESHLPATSSLEAEHAAKPLPFGISSGDDGGEQRSNATACAHPRSEPTIKVAETAGFSSPASTEAISAGKDSSQRPSLMEMDIASNNSSSGQSDVNQAMSVVGETCGNVIRSPTSPIAPVIEGPGDGTCESAAVRPKVVVRSRKCQVCGEADRRYCCPRCGRLTCSLACCRRHKREVGERALESQWATRLFSSSHLSIGVLDKGSRGRGGRGGVRGRGGRGGVEAAAWRSSGEAAVALQQELGGSMWMLSGQLPSWLKGRSSRQQKVVKEAGLRGTRVLLMPDGMSRSKANTTYVAFPRRGSRNNRGRGGGRGGGASGGRGRSLSVPGRGAVVQAGREAAVSGPEGDGSSGASGISSSSGERSNGQGQCPSSGGVEGAGASGNCRAAADATAVPGKEHKHAAGEGRPVTNNASLRSKQNSDAVRSSTTSKELLEIHTGQKGSGKVDENPDAPSKGCVLWWRVEWVFWLGRVAGDANGDTKDCQSVTVSDAAISEHWSIQKALARHLEPRPGNAPLRHRLRKFSKPWASMMRAFAERAAAKSPESSHGGGMDQAEEERPAGPDEKEDVVQVLEGRNASSQIAGIGGGGEGLPRAGTAAETGLGLRLFVPQVPCQAKDPLYWEVYPGDTLRNALARKTVIEFPTIYVAMAGADCERFRTLVTDLSCSVEGGGLDAGLVGSRFPSVVQFDLAEEAPKEEQEEEGGEGEAQGVEGTGNAGVVSVDEVEMSDSSEGDGSGSESGSESGSSSDSSDESSSSGDEASSEEDGEIAGDGEAATRGD